MTYVAGHLDRIGVLLGEHVVLVASALIVALIIALPLGIVAARNARAGAAILAVTGAIYTIPSLALLALLVAALGLGRVTAIVALVAYAQMILIRGVVAGLRGVDPALVDAARGLGLTARQTLLRVEFPAALPVVLGGVRVAAVSLVPREGTSGPTTSSTAAVSGSEEPQLRYCRSEICPHASAAGLNISPLSCAIWRACPRVTTVIPSDSKTVPFEGRSVIVTYRSAAGSPDRFRAWMGIGVGSQFCATYNTNPFHVGAISGPLADSEQVVTGVNLNAASSAAVTVCPR